ncbi:MAG: plasmid mobilization protein [Faecalibacterium prausnitzii]
MNDRRDQQLHFRVSKPELERIRKKIESSGILSVGSYLRKMALDGYCLRLDMQELRRMAYLLQMCSNNLNQYTRAANENSQVYATDLEDLRTRLDELVEISKQILAKLTEL